jgi:hypothetical protein
MCKTDFESEYKEKILDYKLWIDKAEEWLEVAGLLKPEITKNPLYFIASKEVTLWTLEDTPSATALINME